MCAWLTIGLSLVGQVGRAVPESSWRAKVRWADGHAEGVAGEGALYADQPVDNYILLPAPQLRSATTAVGR